MEPIVRKLRCKLTAEERQAKAELLAKLCFDLGELEEKKKAATAEFGSAIKRLKADNASVAYDVRSGSEEREIECAEFPHWEDGVIEIKRLDTMEVVYKRPLTPDERQQRFSHFGGPRPVSRGKRKTDPDPDEGPEDPNPRAH